MDNNCEGEIFKNKLKYSIL